MIKRSRSFPYQDLSLSDLPGERWLDLEGFEGEFEISSLGRIKSLRRWRNTNSGGYYTTEKIRRQHVRQKQNKRSRQDNFTVGSTLKRSGRSISTSTARYVYNAFVAPFDLEDKTIIVSYKDHDGRNLHYKNLILTDRSESAKKSIRLKRSRPKFLEYEIPVKQLTMGGEEIARYPSLTVAQAKTGISVSGISNCLTGFIHQFQGHRWERVDGRRPASKIRTVKGGNFNQYLWTMLAKPRTSIRNPLPVLNLDPNPMEGEEWKPIRGLESVYQISNLGRIKGLSRFKHGTRYVWIKEQVKRLIPDRKKPGTASCLLVSLSKGAKKFQRSVAGLVYLHFDAKGSRLKKAPRIGYKNGKCYDLSLKNLIIK